MTYRLPSLSALRAFEAAARNSSFKAAAHEPGVTPGAISQRVKKLETSLNVDLFQRHANGLSLTEKGEVYRTKIAQIFDDLTEATEEISPAINAKKFTIGVSVQTLSYLPENWPHCSDDLNSHIRESVTTDDLDKLRAGEIDCLIRLGKMPVNDMAPVSILQAGYPNSDPVQILCKPALADCRQTKAIIEDLMTRLSQSSEQDAS